MEKLVVKVILLELWLSSQSQIYYEFEILFSFKYFKYSNEWFKNPQIVCRF